MVERVFMTVIGDSQCVADVRRWACTGAIRAARAGCGGEAIMRFRERYEAGQLLVRELESLRGCKDARRLVPNLH